MRRSSRRGVVALCLVLAAGCERETRRTREIPPAGLPGITTTSAAHPGEAGGPSGRRSPYEKEAYAIAEGQRLFATFNCSGCHGNGGGNIGPPLIDRKWRYGSEPASVYKSIVDGRPDGMPAFRGRLQDYQAWQLVAYVRSLAGLVPKDAASGRQDHMSVKTSEQQWPTQPPRKVGPKR